MKYITIIIIVLFTACIGVCAFTEKQVEKINTLVQKLSSGGVQKIKIIYDWGDGSTEEVLINELTSGSVNHFYEKEGSYTVQTFLYGEKDGKGRKFPIEERQIEYRHEKEELEYDVNLNIPDSVPQSEEVTFSALLKLTQPGIEIKNLKYQWFFDTEIDQYYEGDTVNRKFRIPNSDSKPFYTVKLRIICKYRFMNNKNMWYPFEVIRQGKIKVLRKDKVRIIEYSKILTTENGKIKSPLFITFRDDAYYNSKEFYEKTNIFYKPVLYIDGKAYNTKFVDLKKVKDGVERYNKLIYMIDLENIKIRLRKRKGRDYFAGEVKISDPNGLYSKKIYVLVE